MPRWSDPSKPPVSGDMIWDRTPHGRGPWGSYKEEAEKV